MQAKITKRFVESIRPPERVTYYWDTGLRGFGLRITPGGVIAYVFNYKHGAASRRVTIGRHGEPWTPDTARAEALQLKGRAGRGDDPAVTRRRFREAPTVKVFAARYLADHASSKKRESSFEGDKRLLANHIIPRLGSMKMVDVTRADIATLHRRLAKKRLSTPQSVPGLEPGRGRVKGGPVLANRALALLSKMFNLAEAWGVRPDASNPCRHIERFPETKRERLFSAEELARLGSALTEAERNGQGWPLHKRCPKDEIAAPPLAIEALRLLLFTGARKSEILELRWVEVDLAGCRLNLEQSKTGRKVIPLGAPAAAVLSRLPLDGPWVFPGLGRKGPKSGEPAPTAKHLVGLWRIWEKVRERSGLGDVRIHDLRHAFASAGANSGEALPVIGKILGHRVPATTARYAHLAPDPARAAADRISRSLEAALESKEPATVHVITRGS